MTHTPSTSDADFLLDEDGLWHTVYTDEDCEIFVELHRRNPWQFSAYANFAREDSHRYCVQQYEAYYTQQRELQREFAEWQQAISDELYAS